MITNFTNILFNNIVSVELPMSEMCNMACTYCYITNPIYKMREVNYDSLRKIVDQIPDMFPKFREQKENLYLIPWGAEPLCNWKVIEKLLREELPKNPKLKSKWSTNATLLPNGYINFIKEFQKQIDGLQISLDGSEEVQNYSRKYKSGKDSFKDVMTHIETIKKEVPDLKINYKPTLNSEELEMGFFYKATKFFLTVLKEPVSPVTFVTDFPYSLKAIEQLKKDLEQLKQEWTEIQSINPGSTILIFTKLENPNEVHCSGGRNEVGVDLDGNIYPCHGPMTGDAHQVKYLYKMGNIFTKEQDSDGIYRFMYSKYNSKLLTFPVCSTCKVHSINPSFCYVCPMDNLRGNNSSWMILPSVCEVRKVFADFYQRWNNDRA